MTVPETDQQALAHGSAVAPQLQLLWTALVECGARQDLGQSPKGRRMIVPIDGGRVYPGDGYPTLSGVVLKGGADRQLLRSDGIKELDALYEIQFQTGTVITIRNRVLVDEARQPERYATSTLSVTAPDGPYAWLNRRVILGTLHVPDETQKRVIIRAWLAE